MTVRIEGLNLEKLLCEAQKEGITLYTVRRCADRCLSARLFPFHQKKMAALCERFGWTFTEIKGDPIIGAWRFLRKRKMLFIGATLSFALVALSSGMILMVSVKGDQTYREQVKNYLAQNGAAPGRMKRSVSMDALRAGILLHFPEIAQVDLRFCGSVLETVCHLSKNGEQVLRNGRGSDIFASRDGIVTGITVISGSPAVAVGDAVRAGQVMIRAEEPGGQGNMVGISAQGMVTARVWAHGCAKASLYAEKIEETGRTRAHVTIETPWSAHTLKRAEPFQEQHTRVKTERVIDLFVPLIRKTQIFEEIRSVTVSRSKTDAASMAQGAAENLAKKQLPAGAQIKDKWVEYRTQDGYVYADVVLEYETDIAACSPP